MARLPGAVPDPHRRRSARPVPLPVVLLAVSALLMLVPAAHARATFEMQIARAFFYSALALGILTLFLGIATWGYRPRNPARSHLRSLVGVYVVLPPILALPMAEALPELSFTDAWFEMISAFTTTGATLLPSSTTPPPVHLWRGLVGWAGGFFILISASAILAPLNIGGFELYASRSAGRPAGLRASREAGVEPADRLLSHALALLPAWTVLTLGFWAALHAAGDPALVALMHAMGTLSTSGITSLARFGDAPSGVTGELIIFAGLLLALSRRLLPGAAPRPEGAGPLWRDPELRTALVLILSVPAALSFRHFLSEVTGEGWFSWTMGLHALWGALFTTLSFLTTTGFDSALWPETRVWSGMQTPGLFLLSLAVIGGGVATTTGGVKLLRLYALWSLGRREMTRLADPSSVSGGGPFARHIRTEGASMAFVFALLFAVTMGAVNLLLAALGLEFESALLLSASALSGTGPLAEVSLLGSGGGWSDLSPGVRAVLAFAMILGRLETLALLAFALPQAWAR